jgi:hypothetical protein
VKRRRTGSQVDEHLEDRAGDAPDELRLRGGFGLVVETAERAAQMVEGQVALRDPRDHAVLLEFAGAVRPGEEAAVVAMLLELDDEGARQGRLDELHRARPARQAGA